MSFVFLWSLCLFCFQPCGFFLVVGLFSSCVRGGVCGVFVSVLLYKGSIGFWFGCVLTLDLEFVGLGVVMLLCFSSSI